MQAAVVQPLLQLKPESGVVKVDQPAGASMLLRTSQMREIGGFSRNYALYFEDVDLAKRLSRYGDAVVDTQNSFVHTSEGTAKLAHANHPSG